MSATSHHVYTIGHSTHSAVAFLGLLRQHHIDAVADVRSSPFSRFNPQFNREPLEQFLKANGIRYVFLGRNLARGPGIVPAILTVECNMSGWRKRRFSRPDWTGCCKARNAIGSL